MCSGWTDNRKGSWSWNFRSIQSHWPISFTPTDRFDEPERPLTKLPLNQHHKTTFWRVKSKAFVILDCGKLKEPIEKESNEADDEHWHDGHGHHHHENEGHNDHQHGNSGQDHHHHHNHDGKMDIAMDIRTFLDTLRDSVITTNSPSNRRCLHRRCLHRRSSRVLISLHCPLLPNNRILCRCSPSTWTRWSPFWIKPAHQLLWDMCQTRSCTGE